MIKSKTNTSMDQKEKKVGATYRSPGLEAEEAGGSSLPHL